MSFYSLSTSDLVQGVLTKVGEPINGTSIYQSQVADLLNRAQVKVLSGGNEFVPKLSRPWVWAINPTKYILILNPGQITTATVTFLSTAGTFSIAPVNEVGTHISVQGWWFNVQGSPEWFKVAAHVSGQTNFTLDSIYTDEATAAVNASVTICQLDYTFNITGGVQRLVAPMIVYRPQDLEGDSEQKIYLTDESPMLESWPMAALENKTPTRVAVTYKDVVGNITVRFNSYPMYRSRVEIPYIPMPTTLLNNPTPQFYATVTIASPAVFTKVGHDLANADPFVLSTTGALPTGLTAGTTYYAQNVTVNTYQCSTDVGGSSIVNTTGTQSGTITVIPAQPKTYSVIPIDYVEVLEYIAAHWLAVIKNDDRAEYLKGQAVAIGMAMMEAYQTERTTASKDRGRLTPRLDQYWRGKKYVTQEVTGDS